MSASSGSSAHSREDRHSNRRSRHSDRHGSRNPDHLDADDHETGLCLDDVGSHNANPPPPTLAVFENIHRVRLLILTSIDEPYTTDHLTSPRMITMVIRPLVQRLYNPDDISIVYCLMANRVQFLRERGTMVHQSVNIARATLCELVAARVLRRFHEDNPGMSGLPTLATVLVDGFDPFQGAPIHVERPRRRFRWPFHQRGGYERKVTALELAILSEAKTFISSTGCQRVVEAVYHGRIVYTPNSVVDILPDHYVHQPVTLYDPTRAPLLNHRRLIVPRLRNFIGIAEFLVLVALYVLTLAHRNSDNLAMYEIGFIVYTTGWVVEVFADIIEHGYDLHSQSLWSFLDMTFTSIFGVYLIARVFDLTVGKFHDGLGLNVLCAAAPILTTRVAFNLMPDSILFISLHAMMKDFMMLTFVAMWCFAGFIVALQWMITTDGTDHAPSWATIGKWLLWIWFGLDGTGIEESVHFHVVLGPALMIGFAFLGNTLFLTVLVAMLTNTFSKIIAHETAEVHFRRAVVTFAGVKSDAIFAYPPPFNILALLFLLPLKLAVSDRTFHHVHVTLVRILNHPILLAIGLYERRRSWALFASGEARQGRWNMGGGLLPHNDLQAVFETDPPQAVREEVSALDVASDVDVVLHDAETVDWSSVDMGRSEGLVSRKRRQ
ncbi:nonselective cation channel [Plectosphaerella plurivora]|uniref:Nonselective cation channel n=1 Tax=Plectosphaerella plurivora TaxID=936078 RepID=A0A9P8V4Z0_9PEZI|nr:nonselective cation channel [Plectosphaerella plurivora]